MDRIDAMSTLVAAVDCGSLTAASRALGMPLATVSRKVSDLEAHLRARLVVRTSRTLALTDAGRAYVAAIRRILDDLDDAERAASGEYRTPRGQLTIAAPVVLGRMHVAPILLAFLNAFPEMSARLLLDDDAADQIDDHVDVAVRIGDVSENLLVTTRVGTVGWVTCASPRYLQDRGVPQTPEALLEHDCVMFEGPYRTNAWCFGREPDTTSLHIRPRLAVNTADAAVAAAIASAGITRVFSYQIAPALAAGTLRLVLRPFEPEPLPVHLVHTGQSLMPLKSRAFLDFAAPRLRTSLAA